MPFVIVAATPAYFRPSITIYMQEVSLSDSRWHDDRFRKLSIYKLNTKSLSVKYVYAENIMFWWASNDENTKLKVNPWRGIILEKYNICSGVQYICCLDWNPKFQDIPLPNLTLYAPCIILQYVRIRTNKMHKILMIRLHFLLDALHISETCGCCVAIAIQQPHVWYRHIPNAMYSL